MSEMQALNPFVQLERLENAARAAGRLALPPGFTRVNHIAYDQSGYDADAYFNAESQELLMVSHGANALFGDKDAVFSDGGAQIPVAQKFLKDTLRALPKPPAHITLSGHSLGGVLADAQGVSLLREFPHLPFHLVLFDSIGGSRYAKTLAPEEVKALSARTLSFLGDGISRDFEVFHTLTVLREKLPLFSTHLFYEPDAAGKPHAVDPLADPALGTVVRYPVHHGIQNFIPRVNEMARSIRDGLKELGR